ncbi:MAG: hypothetical protein OHK003_32160 [Anaerolineales bacterium]|jgi:hypothetical protein
MNNDLIEIHGDIRTTPLFWDCECDERYIHPAGEDVCPRCEARREDQPNSRANEVITQWLAGS